MSADPNCVFCKIVAGEVPAFKIYEDDLSLVFLSIDPLSPGHSLVIPKEHYHFVWEIDNQALYSHLFLVARDVATKLKTIYKTELVAEAIEGLEVPHAHIHLIPTNKPLSRLFGGHTTMDPDFKTLEQESQKINKA